MKKTILFFSLITSTILFSQEKEFKMTKEKFTDFVVMPKEGKSAKELYLKTLEWINKTYKNPEKVILAKVENEYIRFEGVKSPLLCKKVLLSTFCDDGKYQIEISLKEGKYKLDVLSLETYSEANKYSPGGWFPVALNDTSFYYKKDGEVKTMFKEYPTVIPAYFNSLNKSLSDYISGTGIETIKNDW